MRKTLLSILALLCLTVSGAWADVLYSGPCGTSGHEDEVRWSLTDNGTFTVYGSGAMADYTNPDDRPWSSYTEYIVRVVIEDGVTKICANAFAGCENLATVTFNCNPVIGSGAIPSGAMVTMNLTANSVGSAKWMTFYNVNYNFQADNNTQVFKVELDNKGGLTLHEVEDKIVNVKEPVVLKSTGSNPVMTMTSNKSNDKQTNHLQGTSEEIKTTEENGYYVLNTGEAGVGFYKLKEIGTIDANKAYLVDDGGIGEPNAREFFLFDEATGIVELKNSRIEELKSDDAWYSLDGRKLDGRSAEGRLQGKKATTKGLYIVGGKKVVIK